MKKFFAIALLALAVAIADVAITVIALEKPTVVTACEGSGC
ncbi:MAG: hypothetical protein P4M15_03625 [Alphaproteobacteria bacterium]|nr:hypothetical protein [Alphaproteobacteria bacterium]